MTEWKHEVSLEKTPYRVLESTSPRAAEMFPVLSRQQTHIGGELVNRYEWNYTPVNTASYRRVMQHHTPGGAKENRGMQVSSNSRFNLINKENI